MTDSKICECTPPQPLYDLNSGNRICQKCRGVVTPLPPKYPPPDFTPVGAPPVTVEKKWFAYDCPVCDHPEVYFQQPVTPSGTQQCTLCRAIVHAEDIIETKRRRDREIKSRLDNPMSRTLSLSRLGSPEADEEE